MPPATPLSPIRKFGALFTTGRYKEVKDPCICFDGTTWHIYGSGGNVKTEIWEILHATAPDIEGPWTEQDSCELLGLSGPHVAAPSVIFDPQDKLFHMAVQKDFTTIGGGIEYLVSADGKVFSWMGTLLSPLGQSEAGLYDPHFSVIDVEKYLVYAGMPAIMTYDRPFVPQPDVYLARSASGLWAGPWERMGKILDHDDIAWHHNRREHPDYEWGIEGPQVVALPNGKYLLNAACFIEEGKRGTRQRVFFAIADDIQGPYNSIGPVLTQRDEEWESGENGHASAMAMGNELYLFYQARSMAMDEQTDNDWSYGIAVYDIEKIMRLLRHEERAQEHEEKLLEEVERAEEELRREGDDVQGNLSAA